MTEYLPIVTLVLSALQAILILVATKAYSLLAELKTKVEVLIHTQQLREERLTERVERVEADLTDARKRLVVVEANCQTCRAVKL